MKIGRGIKSQIHSVNWFGNFGKSLHECSKGAKRKKVETADLVKCLSLALHQNSILTIIFLPDEVFMLL